MQLLRYSFALGLREAMDKEELKPLEDAIRKAKALKHKGALSIDIGEAERLAEVRMMAQMPINANI